MIVVLDTNVVFADPKLRSADFEMLAASLKSLKATLVVPDVVHHEIRKKSRDEITKGLVEITKGLAKIGRFSSEEIVDTLPYHRDRLVKNFLDSFQKRLDELHARRSPLPKANVKLLLERVLEERRPFQRGEAGLRDYLLWESVLELLQTTEDLVLFISANRRDFADESKDGLHPDLAADLNRRGIPRDRLLFFTSLPAFTAARTPGLLEPDLRLKEELEMGVGNFVFSDWVATVFRRECLVPELIQMTPSARNLHLPPAPRIEIGWVLSEPRNTRVVEARRLSASRAIVAGKTAFRASIAFTMDEADYVDAYEDEYDLDIVELDKEDETYLVAAERELEVHVSLVIDFATGDVIAWNASRVGLSNAESRE